MLAVGAQHLFGWVAVLCVYPKKDSSKTITEGIVRLWASSFALF
jgi:hypothetical protein